MYYCKEFYSLSVLSLYEGELLGKVDKLYFDKKLKKLLEMELIGEDGAKLILPTKSIYHIGKNAITVRNNQAVMLKESDCENCLAPIGSKAYTVNGEFLGVIEEILVDKKFNIEKLTLENNNILDVKNLASCGRNAVIFRTGEEKVNIKSFMPNKTPKTFQTEEVQNVSTLPIETVGENVVPVEVDRKPTIQNSDFLLGRVCTKDIFNFNNEVLIKAHAVINKKNLKEANKYGKLRELMLYSK